MKKKLRSEFNSRQYMLSEDFEVFYYSDLHFQSVGRHSHPYTEVYLFAEGEVNMEIGGKNIPLRTGDVIVLPPGTEHRALNRSGDTLYRRFVFWVSEAYCEHLREENGDYLYLFDYAGRVGKYVYHLATPDYNGLRGKLFRLLEELHTESFGRDAQLELYVRDLILYLSRLIYRRQHPQSRAEKVSRYQAVTEYIAGHLEEDLSLDALSRQFFLSKFYLAHLVQENTGLSLHQYITKKRLAACCDAMCGGQSIGECCTRFGFQNYSSFYRAFQKEYGCSPSAYLNERQFDKS